MYETGILETLDLIGKCHECSNYRPLEKIYNRIGRETKFCRGHCIIHEYKSGGFVYKQRTETCKKFEEVAK